LASGRLREKSSRETKTLSSVSSEKSGVDCKLGKVRTRANKFFYLSGSKIRFDSRQSFSHIRERGKIEVRNKIHTQSVGVRRMGSPLSSGNDGVVLGSNPMGETPYETCTTLSQIFWEEKMSIRFLLSANIEQTGFFNNSDTLNMPTIFISILVITVRSTISFASKMANNRPF
jgi:hypothetical protein